MTKQEKEIVIGQARQFAKEWLIKQATASKLQPNINTPIGQVAVYQ